jgi:hypothetical protein
VFVVCIVAKTVVFVVCIVAETVVLFVCIVAKTVAFFVCIVAENRRVRRGPDRPYNLGAYSWPGVHSTTGEARFSDCLARHSVGFARFAGEPP